MKTFILIVLVLALSVAAQSQQTKSKQEQTDSPDTANCAFNFSSGANNIYFRFCVTTTGNIPEIETPQGHLQISSDRHEGYGICNENPVVAYYDYGQYGDSANWNPATVVSQTTKSVKIARTTADGIWTLTQTYSLVPATPSVKVVMAPGVVENNFSATTDGAFGWNASIPFGANSGFGLALENVGQPQFGYLQGFARTTFQPPNPCNFAGESSGTVLTNSDGSVALAYVDSVGAGKTKSATMIYRGM